MTKEIVITIVRNAHGGKVKRKEYLMFVQDVRSAENDDIQSGKITEQERKSLDEIRQMFTEKYGSIYAIE